MKVSNEAARLHWQTASGNDESELAHQLLNAAEAWATAMEPALGQGVHIATIAREVFDSTVPPSLVAFLSHGNDYMVDYLDACWNYGSALQTWYESNRPQNTAEDER